MRFDVQQKAMIDEQLLARGIHDDAVIKVMAELPRHNFVRSMEKAASYEDRPLSIGEKQSISQPYIVALMTQLLELKGDEKVLEIGSGSGYQTAVLAKLSMMVHSVERIESLARRAARALKEVDIKNVEIHIGDGSLGWPEAAPYDRILVTAAAPRVPKDLLDQLDEGAFLVLPVGKSKKQKLQRWQKIGNRFKHEDLTSVAFVPLIGEQGWQENK